MKTRLLILFQLVLLLTSCAPIYKPPLSPAETVDTYAYLIQKKYKVQFDGTTNFKNFYGEDFGLDVYVKKFLDIDETRKLTVQLIDEYLSLRNSDKIYNPFPYKIICEPKNINISILMLLTKHGKVPPNLVYFVCFKDGIISYNISHQPEPATIHKETYEEAVKILQAQGIITD